MRKSLLLTISFAIVTASGFSQTDKFWSANNESRGNIIADKSVSRLSYPKEFKLFNLNYQSLNQALLAIVDNKSSKKSTIISLPNADGKMEQFEMFEASNFEPELQARFPEIRAYSGNGITDRYATIKLSLSPQGIQTMVFRTEKENEFIEPYSKDHTVYSVFRSQREKGKLPWSCSTDDKRMAEEIKADVQKTQSSAGQLKTMRLAQSCNAEYSNYFGATSAAQVGLVLAAFNATLTRCNGVYEKDLALHLNLVAGSTNVIYYNPATDPYTTLSSWNTQLQIALNTTLTGAATTLAANNAAYDIGHMFGASGGGGNAGCIGCVCADGVAAGTGATKGRGITSPADGIPQGDNFDIDYVVHEIGHQLGGNHTFSMSNEGSGVNKEVGSGITIMGYAGITAQDVAPHSIDIYHQATIEQIQTNMATKTCLVNVNMTANRTPVVLPVGNYTIPKSTPFALTGSATDLDNDTLTYCWEQNDNATSAQTGASSIASPTKATGPNWLSFKPTISGTRLFPKLSTILSGLLVTPALPGGSAGTNIEALSSVARTLNFRLTVRDNNPYVTGVKVGQTAYTDAVVTVSAASGPFAVTAPNTAVSWNAGSTQTVTWSVNSTNVAPVNCANVKISLSTDGGLTFPTVLSASTPNDGTESLVIPANTANSTTARIKIEAVGNIFFDISNTNFSIPSAISCGDPTSLSLAALGTTTATLSWGAVSNVISYAVDYKAASSGTWISAATATTATSISLTGLTSGTLYDWRVKATCTGGVSGFVTAQFTTVAISNCISVYDNNQNNRARSAAVIPFNTDIKGLLDRSGDIDYYKFSITNGGTATITLSVPNDYDMDLINNTGIVALASSKLDSTNSETIAYTYTPNTYYVKVYGKFGSFTPGSCYTLRVQLGTASRNTKEVSTEVSNVAIYPNPVQGNMKISMGGSTEQVFVNIADMFGRNVISRKFSNMTEISTSKLAAGVYMVTVTDKNGTVIKQDKMVKE